jgi:hypothetical protein
MRHFCQAPAVSFSANGRLSLLLYLKTLTTSPYVAATHHAVEDLPKNGAGTSRSLYAQLEHLGGVPCANAPYPDAPAGREACITMGPVHGHTKYAHP